MSETPHPDLERRLAALEQGYPRRRASQPRGAPLLAMLIAGLNRPGFTGE